MKIGIRKPNVKKRVKARTTGKLKRQAKRAVNPLYGKKGMGIINDPKKSAYNAVYSKTTVGVDDLLHTDFDTPNDLSSNPSFFELVCTFFALLFTLVKLVFWIAIVVAIIAFLIWIF